MKNSKMKAISVIFLFSLIITGIFYTSQKTFAQVEENKTTLQLQVPIPGNNGSAITICDRANPDAPYRCDGISRYIVVVYRWIMGFVAMLAMLAFVYAGVLWMNARGDSGQVGEAKKVMVNAIVGLVLTLGSYTLLWAINPRLVQMKSLELLGAKKIEIKFEEAKEEDNIVKNPDGVTGAGFGELRNNVPYFNQGNSQWATLVNIRTRTSIQAGGCGITSYAMIAKFYGKNVTPKNVFELNGNDNNTNFEKLKNIPALGLNHDRVDANKMDELVRNGKPVILRTENSRFTSKKHFIVITGFDGVNYTINDPGHAAFTTATREEVTKDALYYEYVHP